MVFVNEIGEIVHSIVDFYMGNANKNIGDAFLLVWKYPDYQIDRKLGENGIEVTLKNEDITVCQLADMAIISFLKIIAKINRADKILKY